MAKSKVKDFLAHHATPRKLVFYFFFYGLHIALFIVGWWKQVTDPRLAALNTLKYSVWISRGAGLVLSVDTTIILLPMCRTLLRIIRPKIKWIPLDESIWFHRQVAYQLLFWSIVHVSAHYVNFYNVEKSQIRPLRALDIHYTQAGGITGHIMLLCMLLMYTTAHASIRKQSFEAFWYTHHLFIPFMLAMYTHATGCFVRDSVDPYSPFDSTNWWTHCIGYNGWRWELVGGGLYLIERLYREVRARRETRIKNVILIHDTVEIQFTKPSFGYKPGQWLFINCPLVSYYQWHPFTITSCPYDPYISIHMRKVGDFTNTFANALGAGPDQEHLFDDKDPLTVYQIALEKGHHMPQIRVDGPYGAPAEDVFENEIAVLIGTGIGVTPWASILKNIWHLRQNRDPKLKLKKVEFIWICRNTESFAWFQALLLGLEQQSKEADPEGKDGFLSIRAYLTTEFDVDEMTNVIVQSVGASQDPLTKLTSRTHFGRPDFFKLFQAMAHDIPRGWYLPGAESTLRTSVGVYFCGPNTAAKQIKQACVDATTKDVKFKFWKEHF